MRGARRRRTAESSVVAVLLLGCASAAFAQQSPPPAQPKGDTTTVVEPVAKPDAGQPSTPPKKPTADQGPKHVPPDSSGIDLTTLETKDLTLVYFDPIQTY